MTLVGPFLAATLAVVGAAPARGPVQVAAPLVMAPASPRGTVLLVHEGGWSGPDAAAQRRLSAFPGAALRRRGHRTVSVDYARGRAGLDSVLEEVAARGGRVCLYGESAGGTLALLAAARDRRIRCVLAFGAPTDFGAWRRDAARRARDPAVDAQVPAFRRATALAVLTQTVVPAFGPIGAGTRPWEPARVAARIRGRVVLGQQRDDFILPLGQLRAFASARPGTPTFVTPSGGPADRYLHGTLPAAGRAELVRRLLALLAPARAYREPPSRRAR